MKMNSLARVALIVVTVVLAHALHAQPLTGNYEVTGTLSAGGDVVGGNNTNTVTGNHAVVLGYLSLASGNSALAVNFGSLATGEFSTAFGGGNVSGNYSISLAGNSTAIAAIAIGLGTSAMADNSLALGHFAIPRATESIVLGVGDGTLAQQSFSYRSIVVGTRSAYPSSPAWDNSTWVAGEPIFIVGNGNSAYSNALLIAKNGNLGVGNFVDPPSERVEVTGRLRLDSDAGTALNAFDGILRWYSGSDLQLGYFGRWVSLLGPTDNLVFPIPASTGDGPNLRFGNSTTTGLFSPDGAALAITTNGTERLRVMDVSGNIGIGTDHPTHKLEVAGTGNISGWLTTGSGVDLGAASIRGLASGNATVPAMRFNSSNSTGLFSPSGGNIALSANGTERLRASSNATVTITGNLNIGNSTLHRDAIIQGGVIYPGHIYGDISMGAYGD